MTRFIADLLEEYKLSSDNEHRQNLLQEFKDNLWNSKYKNYKYKKRIHYMVKEELLVNQQSIDLFNKYNDIKYTVEKSYHKKRNDILSIDYIRIHINNLYSKLFDKDTYMPKEYYQYLFIARNLYFKTIKMAKDEQCLLDVSLLENEIIDSLNKAGELKNIHIKEQKCDLSFSKYKKLINGYIDSLFENYIVFDDYKRDNDWKYHIIDSTIVFGEENYTIRYFNKSLSGYLRNYFRNDKGIKRVKENDKTVGMFKVNDVFDKFSILQIGISRFFENKDELLKIDDKFYSQITPIQKELLNKIKEVVNLNDILFYANGLPYFKFEQLSDKIFVPVDTLKYYFININNRINEIKNNKGYKFCECCGIKIKKIPRSNIKYCKECGLKISRKMTNLRVKKFNRLTVTQIN